MAISAYFFLFGIMLMYVGIQRLHNPERNDVVVAFELKSGITFLIFAIIMIGV